MAFHIPCMLYHPHYYKPPRFNNQKPIPLPTVIKVNNTSQHNVPKIPPPPSIKTLQA
ncbi:hypothetical protein BDV41DRAFT_551584 [Aspergillus transmontanensis]|uniref:Uncharacterized protein n=1 Tax=Aspergillus transmontanensis TaxID=1034304 RepID=A0A5N6VIT3_9EURO|nr:hypothetical protein BDV41DRAFT_551584 [Aspergillus transmontanensis]